jgi:hypothetical protein
VPSPFPGMDPYLEHAALWPDVHHGLIEALRNALAPLLRPRYRIAVEERVYVTDVEGPLFIGRPDVSVVNAGPPTGMGTSAPVALVEPRVVEVPLPDRIREGYLEVRDVATGEVVTAVEILSPTNKRPGEGRRLYEGKRLQVLGTRTHLVEIDLLRGGEPMKMWGDGKDSHYRILVSRADRRPRADLYAFNLRDLIPPFSLPLRPGDEEPLVDLGTLLHALYDRAGYDLALDYTAEPVPPLEGDDVAWADQLLRDKGLR